MPREGGAKEEAGTGLENIWQEGREQEKGVTALGEPKGHQVKRQSLVVLLKVP